MGKAQSYNSYAATYAETRRAAAWVTKGLQERIAPLAPASRVLEVGCGTCNYTLAILDSGAGHVHLGLDCSMPMLRFVKTRCPELPLVCANADLAWPLRTSTIDLAFCVDVIHHVTELQMFFTECRRVLKKEGRLAIVTDSREDILGRSLTHFFPEIRQVELDRYPAIDELKTTAAKAGLGFLGQSALQGEIELTDDFLSAIERKFSSAMRIIPDEAHRRGVERVREAQRADQLWLSRYTLLTFLAQ